MWRTVVASLIVTSLASSSSPAADLLTTITISGSPGPYTTARWRADWQGCQYEDGVEEGRVAVVAHVDENWLRVTCWAKQIGPDRGGAGWRWPLPQQDSAELRFTAQIASDFEFVKEGKLMGLAGGPESVTGGNRPTGKNGFSARIIWLADGRAAVYAYHMDQPGQYGENFAFPKSFRFPKGQEVGLRLAVGMNRPDQRDGWVKAWALLPGQNEQLMVEKTGLRWRSVDAFSVDSVLFESFFGGGDSSYAPPHDCQIDFGRISVRRP